MCLAPPRLTRLVLFLYSGTPANFACRSDSAMARCLGTDHPLDLVVADQNQSAAESAQHVRSEPLEHRRNALITNDLHGAIQRTVVEPLLLRLLGLHLQPTANRVERIRDETGDDCSRLRNAEFRDEADDALVLLPWVKLLEGVKYSKIGAAISNDAHNRDSETSVHAEEAARLHRLHQAVAEARELGVPRTDVRGE